ncbi:Peptidase M15 [Roseibium album]|nr:Peptidase M15 [Roseibium album]
MDKKLEALLDLATSVIPAVGSLVKDDKTGELASEILTLMKKIAKLDDADQVKEKIENDPAAKVELRKQLVEIANQKAEKENRAREEYLRVELKNKQKNLEAQENQHKNDLELLQKDLESTNAARAFAEKAATSDSPWVSWLNPALSIIITGAFIAFIFIIAREPLDKENIPPAPSVTDSRSTPIALAADPAPTTPATDPTTATTPAVSSTTITAADPTTTTPIVDPATIPTNAESSNSKEVFLVAFGALAAAFATVVGFHFGSSSGSKRKSKLQRYYGTRGLASPSNPHGGSAAQDRSFPLPGGSSKTGSQASHPFEAFWLKNLSHIDHFNWEEVLFKGNSNQRYKSNTDPDPSLYNNVVPLMEILDKIRKEVGAPVKLTSIYRNPAYNRDVGGAEDSRHMYFDAADFKVIGPNVGNSGSWYKIAKRLRDSGEFKGGIGIYNSFVHIDTRGRNAFWDER